MEKAAGLWEGVTQKKKLPSREKEYVVFSKQRDAINETPPDLSKESGMITKTSEHDDGINTEKIIGQYAAVTTDPFRRSSVMQRTPPKAKRSLSVGDVREMYNELWNLRRTQTRKDNE